MQASSPAARTSIASNADPRARRIAEAPVGKLLWSFSLPAVAGMIVGSLYAVIDRAFLGNFVGPDALAGVSLCMPVAFFMMAFSMLIGIGSGALVSIKLGEQKKDEAEQVLGNALTLILVMSVGLTTVFLLTLRPLLSAFGASAHTLPYAMQFMRVILLGSFFQYTAFGLNAAIRAEGNARLAMATMFIAAGLNIVLDVIFVWRFGFGVTGAAVATVISQGVAAVWTLVHFRSRRAVLRLRVSNLRLRWDVAGPALAIGVAPFAMQIAASGINLVINRSLALYGGDIAISAFGVISATMMMFFMPVFGLNQGAQPIIGYNFGARRPDRVRRTLELAILAATAVMCAGFVVAETVPAHLMRVFSGDAELIALGSRGLRLWLAMMPVIGFQMVSANFFQAIGKARTALVLTLLRQVIILLPLLELLPRRYGLLGVWVAAPISDLASSVLTGVALRWQLRDLRAMEPAAAAAEAVG